MSHTRIHLTFKNAGSDLDNDSIAIGSIGETSVYKYLYQFPSGITNTESLYAVPTLGSRALLDDAGAVVPYNLTCDISAVNTTVYAEILLHIYGPATEIATIPSGNATTSIDNIEIQFDYFSDL